VQIKALACEMPALRGLPLSRFSCADIAREAQHCGIVARISDTTVWRWLDEDAIRPWQHRTWIFPRDPDFALKAGRILDLYAKQWEGKRLRPGEFVLSTDEKTSMPASANIPPCHRARTVPLASNTSMRVAGHGPTWRRLTYTVPKSSAVASKPLVSSPSVGSSPK
jgi:hypothetical protein